MIGDNRCTCCNVAALFVAKRYTDAEFSLSHWEKLTKASRDAIDVRCEKALYITLMAERRRSDIHVVVNAW